MVLLSEQRSMCGVCCGIKPQLHCINGAIFRERALSSLFCVSVMTFFPGEIYTVSFAIVRNSFGIAGCVSPEISVLFTPHCVRMIAQGSDGGSAAPYRQH